MEGKQPLISASSDDNDTKSASAAPADPPPSYVAAAREHGIPLRQSAPIRKGGLPPPPMQMPMPMPPGPPQPLDLPIIQYMKSHRVILASASPRRRAMLAQLGLSNIEVRPSTKPEDLSKAELGPHGYVAATARQKALDVYQEAIRELEEAEEGKNGDAEKEEEEEEEEEEREDGDDDANEDEDGTTTTTAAGQGQGQTVKKDKNKNKNKKKARPRSRPPHPGGDPDLVIAADTVIVTRDGQILEKPASAAAHARMLRHLRDTRFHRVLTAVCAVAPRADAQHPGYELRAHVAETRVHFARAADGLPDDVIDAYVRTREGADKAGGYAIQGLGGMLLVERVEGPVDNVVGLPVRHALRLCERVVFRQGRASAAADGSDGEDEDEDEDEDESDGDGGGDW